MLPSVGYRRGSNLVRLRLWCSLATAASIPPLAWELPQAVGVALKDQKKKGSASGQWVATTFLLIISVNGGPQEEMQTAQR